MAAGKALIRNARIFDGEGDGVLDVRTFAEAEKGAWADLLVVDGDPTEELSVRGGACAAGRAADRQHPPPGWGCLAWRPR